MIGAVIGNGFVGQATSQFATDDVPFLIYDTDPSRCIPPSLTLEDVRQTADLIFICVPTPMDSATGECCTSIVEKVIAQLDHHPGIVVRSTVPVGFCEKHGVAFLPEFLTEANARQDFVESPEWFLGADLSRHGDTVDKMRFLLEKAREHGRIRSDSLVVLSTKEAEMLKYFRNTFLATKVSFCNEIQTFCTASGVEYDRVIRHAARDPRIGMSHTMVPGPDGKRGFGGTCFPKDVASLLFQMRSNHVASPVLSSVDDRNNRLDRPEMDWTADKGRAVV